MHTVCVHDAKIAKENGFTLQFCSNYPPKMSRICAMYTFLTNYNTIWEWFLPNTVRSFHNKTQAILTPHTICIEIANITNKIRWMNSIYAAPLYTSIFIRIYKNGDFRVTKEKALKDVSSRAFLCLVVGLPRFELGQTEPKPVVLPLHHSPNLCAFC